MSSEPDPATSFLLSSVGSRSTDLPIHHHRPYGNSPWIRRLHLIPSPPTPTPSTSVRDSRCVVGPTNQTHNTTPSNESHTPLKLSHGVQEDLSEVVSGFGPFKFKAIDSRVSRQFPLVARIARFGGEERIADRNEGFKISPFFQFRPPLPVSVQNFSEMQVPVNLGIGMAETHDNATEARPNISVQGHQALNLANKGDEPFSYWNFGHFNRNNTISSSSKVPFPGNLPRKRRPIKNHIFPPKLRRSEGGGDL